MEFTDQRDCERFLVDHHGFSQTAVPWMARWVAAFLAGLPSMAHWDSRCREFYHDLEERVPAWRLAQAAKSVQLYRAFRGELEPDAVPANGTPTEHPSTAPRSK